MYQTLVHEWSHLRWGVYDEYAYSNKPDDHFYENPVTRQIEATRCVEAIPGKTIKCGPERMQHF